MQRFRSSPFRLLTAATGALLVVAACTSTGSHRASSPTPAPSFSVSPSTIDTRTPIKHVIFIIKENRSFDNLFGRFPGANGATKGKDGHRIRPLTRGYDQRMPHDLPHDYIAAVKEYDHGKMDMFNITDAAEKYAYTQMRPNQLPNYWHWAQQNVLADYFFASVNGPSFPNHLFTIAATSGGTHDNPLPPKGPRGKFKTWGCDAPKTEIVKVEDTEGKVHNLSPCFDFKTLGDLLQAHSVPWAYYAAPPVPYPDSPHSGYIWSTYSSIRHIRNNPAEWRSHVFDQADVVDQISKGELPSVTWITPQFAVSEHPEYNFCYGENWTTRIVDAVMRSAMWKDTAIFITWDDWGGFYDHVPPPQIDRFGLGIRVPLLVMSPYAKQGFVDHSHGEFSSVLRFIEDNWGLPQLTKRDRRAGNLFQDFDFAEEPRAPDPLPQRTDCKGPVYSPPPPGAYA